MNINQTNSKNQVNLSLRQMKDIINCLNTGGVVLLPTDTIYGLAAKPEFENAIDNIYKLKERPRIMNLPIMVSSVEELEMLGLDINVSARKLRNSDLVPGAISLVLGFKTAPTVAWLEGREEIAVRIPNDKNLLSILKETGALLVTSANKHGDFKKQSTVKEIISNLNGKPDLTLEGNTKKEIASTIINCRFEPPKIERVGSVSKSEIFKVLNQN